jgi:hypothetical protein
MPVAAQTVVPCCCATNQCCPDWMKSSYLCGGFNGNYSLSYDEPIYDCAGDEPTGGFSNFEYTVNWSMSATLATLKPRCCTPPTNCSGCCPCQCCYKASGYVECEWSWSQTRWIDLCIGRESACPGDAMPYILTQSFSGTRLVPCYLDIRKRPQDPGNSNFPNQGTCGGPIQGPVWEFVLRICDFLGVESLEPWPQFCTDFLSGPYSCAEACPTCTCVVFPGSPDHTRFGGAIFTWVAPFVPLEEIGTQARPRGIRVNAASLTGGCCNCLAGTYCTGEHDPSTMPFAMRGPLIGEWGPGDPFYHCSDPPSGYTWFSTFNDGGADSSHPGWDPGNPCGMLIENVPRLNILGQPITGAYYNGLEQHRFGTFS